LWLGYECRIFCKLAHVRCFDIALEFGNSSSHRSFQVRKASRTLLPLVLSRNREASSTLRLDALPQIGKVSSALIL
jgi:hypothetical protein